MDATGLVLSVAALWTTCVQIFDVVESGRRYGMDYEILRVKLEVERIRLFNWGEAVGLSGDVNGRDISTAGPSRVSTTSRADVRLQRKDVNDTVMTLLGYIQHVFENSERMQSAYGLLPATRGGTQDGSTVAGSSSQLVLGAVFRKSYERLKRTARERQRTTTVARRTIWAIHDKKKFQAMVIEIRGFNDSLESLFPGSRSKIAEVMRDDVEASQNINELQLLQNATIDDHADISDAASCRLGELGAPSTARTELLSEQIDAFSLNDRERKQENEQEDEGDAENRERKGEDNSNTVTAVKPPLTDAEKRLNEVEQFIQRKEAGALSLHVVGPHQYSARVTTHCYWGGQAQDPWWRDQVPGIVATTHAAYGKSTLSSIS
jgi:Prion-inhibition and propagation